MRAEERRTFLQVLSSGRWVGLAEAWIGLWNFTMADSLQILLQVREDLNDETLPRHTAVEQCFQCQSGDYACVRATPARAQDINHSFQ